jgi:hypothetical protein
VFGADTHPVLLSEEELVETALLKYAQQAATKWGADRFAAEFERRDLEERWLVAARSQTTPYSGTMEADAPKPAMMSGPVDAAAQESVVGSDRDELALTRPKHERHPSVPRPPGPEPEPSRRGHRRRKRQPSSGDPAWIITSAERARMTAAARRLYGLDDPPAP